MDLLELSSEEKDQVGWTDEVLGQASWDDSEREFELEFEDADYAHLKNIVLSNKGWLPSRPLGVLLKKIEETE
jgi:hypothetical protein